MIHVSPFNGEIVTSTVGSLCEGYFCIMTDDILYNHWGDTGSSINISTGISVATLRRASSLRFDEEIQVPVYFGESLQVEAPALSPSHIAEVVYMYVQGDYIGSTFGIGVNSFAHGFAFVSWNVLCYHLMSGTVDLSRITIHYPLLQWKDVDVHAPSASLCAAGYSRGGNFSDSPFPMCAGNDYGFHFLTPTQLVSSHDTLYRHYLILKIKSTFGFTKKHPELLLRDGYSVGTYQVVKKYSEFMLRDAYGPSSDVIGWGAVESLSLFIGAL
jgi:hypothetical protein